ncbi:hypothetical protein ACU5AY_09565 [Rhizobium sp. PAMB 3174]
MILLAAGPFATPAFADCTCSIKDGTKLSLGQVTCIRINDMAYLARCEMVLNNTSWQKIQDGCPMTQLRPVRHAEHQSAWQQAVLQ